MIYRDSMESCPRCTTELETAGAMRACSTCSGVWIGVSDLDEMASQMQTPAQPIKLEPFGSSDGTKRLPCPSCGEPMQQMNLLDVGIDMCPKKHGIWFDASELAQVLLRSANLTP